jgi:hypothetical protein
MHECRYVQQSTEGAAYSHIVRQLLNRYLVAKLLVVQLVKIRSVCNEHQTSLLLTNPHSQNPTHKPPITKPH